MRSDPRPSGYSPFGASAGTRLACLALFLLASVIASSPADAARPPNVVFFLADDLGWTGGFVGFALVAVGTSLPELVTALAAARRGESGLILGNLLGSNLFNGLMVGAAVFLANGATPYDKVSGLPDEPLLVMVAVSWGVIWFMRTGRRIDRREAAFLIVAYAGLLGWLATNSAVA